MDIVQTQLAPVVEVSSLEVRAGDKILVTGVDLALSRGEVVSIIGPNGAGKTTLIRAVLGLVKPSSGSVRIAPGTTIGYMPQRIELDRNLPMTVRRFLGLAGRFEPGRRREVLEETGVAHLVDASVHDLSGGEWRRVLLARALLRNPDLLVLDEPVQAMDVHGQAELYRLIADIRNRRGCGVLMVSHDLHVVMSATDRVICINTHLCCAGHPDAVSRDPSYVALFGPQVAETLALYHHRHDHAHAVDGTVVEGAEDHSHG